MSKAATSPTARLLRSSRLFSLPRPLPPPPLSALESTGVFRASPTATEPYPTYQAIASPASSRSRGDWGLKRPLPNRRLQTSNPTVRIRAQDTPEHITDFGSAGDHVNTERKWAELGVPMVQRPDAVRRDTPTSGEHMAPPKPLSVFEDWLDNTSTHSTRKDQLNQRWKSTGPWLGGMQEGEFQSYLDRTISAPEMKEKWLSFLRTKQTQDRLRAVQRQAREEGRTLTPTDIQQITPRLNPSDTELNSLTKTLRDGHTRERLSSELTSLIAEFLDLPNITAASTASASSYSSPSIVSHVDSSAERGPPTTHPSAGLSHLRTNAYMPNHPIHGPQIHRSPVQARIVRPRTSAGATLEYQAKLGVAGVVTNDTQSATSGTQIYGGSKERDDPAHALNPEIEGGGKLWVHADSAWVDEKGRIRLDVARGDVEAVAVKTGVGLEEIHSRKARSKTAAAATAPGFAAMPVSGNGQVGRGRRGGNWGLGGQ